MKIETGFTRKTLSSGGGKSHLALDLIPPDEPRDKRPVCVVMAIDMCEQMAEPDRLYGFTDMYTPIISHVRMATYELIGELGDEDLFGCVVFNHQGFICQELIHPVSMMVPDIKIQVSRIIPHGGRNIADGLMLAGKMITERVAAEYKCQVILVTNGKSTSPLSIGQNLAGICGMLGERDIKVNLVGCGKSYSLPDFIEMTAAGGGKAHHVQNYEHLQEIFREETEALRDESAVDAKLIIRHEKPLEICRNLNGYPQKTKAGKTEIHIGRLCEPVRLHFELKAGPGQKALAEMEFAAVYRESPCKACRKTVFETLKLAEKDPESLPCDSHVLRTWLAAFAAKTLKEAALSYDKCSLKKMRSDFDKAKKSVKDLAAIYPGQSDLLQKCLETMDKEGKIFLENKLGIGENKTAYFELNEILGKKRKKTIKNLYI